MTPTKPKFTDTLAWRIIVDICTILTPIVIILALCLG